MITAQSFVEINLIVIICSYKIINFFFRFDPKHAQVWCGSQGTEESEKSPAVP